MLAHLAQIVLSILVLLVFFETSLAAFVGGVILLLMRRRHKAFLHMALVKFGIAAAIVCLFVSHVDMRKPGLHVVLQGWGGWWTVAAILLISIPLHGLVRFLLFGKTPEQLL